ncbi:hypothetical protein ABIA22_005347 [Sinorhizobium fredii]|nr:hypothetical protein AB395_00004863 [Sinorhizobium fredii CCBAU 45436]
MFTLDAELYSPDAPPALGRAAIEALHCEWMHGGVPDKELRVIQAGGSRGKVPGTSLEVWQREDDGSWRIRMCSLNSDEYEAPPE